MKDMSLHIIDIIQNSVRAEASLINMDIVESKKQNIYSICIKDNGKGIPPEILETVTDPFTTSRTTRKVGLGIPLFKQNAELTGGSFHIESKLGEGTLSKATFVYDHIDRLPIGDLSGSLILMVYSNPEKDFVFKHTTDDGEYVFDTREIKAVLGDVPLNNSDVRRYLLDMLKENLIEIKVESC